MLLMIEILSKFFALHNYLLIDARWLHLDDSLAMILSFF
jgi:hypothetical protein